MLYCFEIFVAPDAFVFIRDVCDLESSAIAVSLIEVLLYTFDGFALFI